MMIPTLENPHLSPWPVLPAGIHPATLEEVESVFASNAKRRRLFAGFRHACKALREAGCTTVFLDGSFVTAKPNPGDYDACWDPNGVDPNRLDPVFLDFDNARRSQKLKYGGEFFPFGWQAEPGKTFLTFFQNDRFTGQAKGILTIDLTCEPLE
jgi:hypothetical protein